MNRLLYVCVVTWFAAGLLAPKAVADYVVKGVTGASSTFFSPDQTWLNLNNGAGLSIPMHLITVPDVANTTHDFSSAARRQWHSAAGDPLPWVSFAFERKTDLRTVAIWNANQTGLTGRGVASFDLQVSTDGGNNWLPALTNQKLPRSPGDALIFPKLFDLTGTNGITNARLLVRTNYGDSVTGLSEVLFIAAGDSEEALIADSQRDFSSTQGEFGWSCGYYAGPYTPSAFQLMPSYSSGAWSVDLSDPAPSYWTYMGDEMIHPNGVNTTTRTKITHWPVRRWTAWTSGAVQIDITLRDLSTDTNSNGQRLVVFHGNQWLQERLVSSFFSVRRVRLTRTVAVGETLDFAIDPVDGNDMADSISVIAQISLMGPDSLRFPSLDYVASSGNNSSRVVRWPKVCLNYRLQSSTRLSAPWTTVTTGITSDRVFFSCQLTPVTTGAQFLRLVPPAVP